MVFFDPVNEAGDEHRASVEGDPDLRIVLDGAFPAIDRSMGFMCWVQAHPRSSTRIGYTTSGDAALAASSAAYAREWQEAMGCKRTATEKEVKP